METAIGFNRAQAIAVAHHEGPLMVLAGPGSGKTLVITKRIEYLIRQHKVRPEEILVITFTKAAAREMKARFVSLVKGESLPVTFGTFHGIYYGILKWAYRMNAGNILSEEEKYRVLKEVMGKLPPESGMDMQVEDEKEFIQGIAGEISNIKNNGIDIDHYYSLSCPENTFREIFRQYEYQRKAIKKIDFDDMLVLCYELFTKREDILKKWQERFRYILIDEFQDINKVQYDVIRMLAAPENNLFIVGDDDQSIYRFRGARPEIMLGFPKDYPTAETVLLDVNYRSSKAIVTGALRVINKNTNRYPKTIHTQNEQGADIHVQEVKHPAEESQYILRRIEAVRKEGVEPSQIAVLFRTNVEARTLAETLMEYNVPFQMKEHLPNLYEHFIARDIMCYMRMALGSRQRKDFLAVMNRPNRYIGRDSMSKSVMSFEELRSFYGTMEWMQDRIDQMEFDLKLIRKMAPYAAIQYIRKRIGYDDFLKEYAAFRRMNLADLTEMMEELQEKAKAYKTMEEWFEHIEKYTKELKEQAAHKEEQKNAVMLMTMHGAKGLEYDTVFLIGANEDIIPYKKAKLPEEVEEERRMFYVAMTRAKNRLVITYTKERNGKELAPSRFVEELLILV